MNTKKCNKCNKVLNITEFRFRKYSNKYQSICIDCDRKTKQAYYINNKTDILKAQKEAHILNPQIHRDIYKKHFLKHHDRILKNSAAFRMKNKEWFNEYWNDRRKTDIKLKILCGLRTRLCNAMKGKNKSKPTKELIGCNIEHLQRHLESQFKDGMTWDNYGYYGWHIDHIKPCALFDLTDINEQRKCFHYSNLQPLWCIDNIKKSDNWKE